MAQSWYVYVLKCADETLYTGICTNVERRVKEHNEGNKGARYTRSRRPVSVLYTEAHTSRATASRREAEIKKDAAGKKTDINWRITGIKKPRKKRGSS